jgi:hypothetical protein
MGAAGHIVSSEMSLGLILGDSLDIALALVVSLSPVYCGSKQLVETLGYLQLLLD